MVCIINFTFSCQECWKSHFRASKFQNFLGEHAPRPPLENNHSHLLLYGQTPTSNLIESPDILILPIYSCFKKKRCNLKIYMKYVHLSLSNKRCRHNKCPGTIFQKESKINVFLQKRSCQRKKIDYENQTIKN